MEFSFRAMKIMSGLMNKRRSTQSLDHLTSDSAEEGTTPSSPAGSPAADVDKNPLKRELKREC